MPSTEMPFSYSVFFLLVCAQAVCHSLPPILPKHPANTLYYTLLADCEQKKYKQTECFFKQTSEGETRTNCSLQVVRKHKLKISST